MEDEVHGQLFEGTRSLGTRRQSDRRPDLLQSAVIGLVGGLIASWAMNQFQAAVAKWQADDSASQPKGDDATVKVAMWVSRAVTGRSLTPSQKKVAGPLVHYTFGSAMGALYAVGAAMEPEAAAGWGLLYGTALWLGADEITVPAAGLSKPPADVPIAVHGSALAAHLVFGATVETVRRVALSR